MSGPYAEQRDEADAGRIVVGDLAFGQRADDALRPTGGAAGVEHEVAPRLGGQPLGGVGRKPVLVGLEAVDRATEHQADRAVGEQGGERGDRLAERRRRHQRPGVAVVHDVGGFLRRQVAVDRREVQARSERGPDDLEVLGPVLGEDRHVVARPQAGRPPQLRQPPRPLLQLAVGEHRPGARHDHRRLGRVGLGVGARVGHGVLGRSAARTLRTGRLAWDERGVHLALARCRRR